MPRLPRSPVDLRAWLRHRPQIADVLLAAVLLSGVMSVWLATPREVWPMRFGEALLWSGLGLLPVAVRRRWLWGAIAFSAAANVIAVWTDNATGAEGFALAVMAYTVASHRRLRGALLGTLALFLPPHLLVLLKPDIPGLEEVGLPYVFTVNTLTALVVFFIGRTVHTRRRYVTALEERAEAAEANQVALAAQAVADERRRIARELHDVVAHHVSVMGVLATGARRAGDRDLAAADAALAGIEETGRSAMRDLRRLLDVLRTEGEPAELAPQPGLSGVRTLVEQIRDTGLPVTVRVDGDAADLDPGVALTAYRIVQEALTNTIKHAGPARAVVRLTCRCDLLTVEVTDDGRGPSAAPPGVGHGLVGMRERTALYGGRLHTGARPGGGFRVYATIPVEPPAAAARANEERPNLPGRDYGDAWSREVR